MIPAIGNIYSILGNNNSLVPMAIKDIANSCGLTAGSYITGNKLEGKDRFIDEFGTQSIWLFGIPAYKKILDLTLYKALKIDHKFDVRNLKENRKTLLEKSIEYADSSIKESMKTAAKNQKFTKNLAMAKFIVSTALTILSYWGLTKYRHNVTEKAAKKEILAEMQSNENNNKFSNTKPQWQVDKKQPTFTGSIQEFMYNPVKNLMILDGAITTERLAHSRNPQELMGYTIKEGTFWAFMYFASKPIQKFLENRIDNNTKKPASIDLDARVIESKELEEAIKSDSLKKSVAKVLQADTPEKLLEYIHNNPDDFTVKMAKMSDVLPTLKEANQADNIDYRKFIDLDEFKSVAEKLNKLNDKYEAFKELNIKDISLEAFIKQVRKYKRSATLANIGACIGVLGVLAPAIMVAVRKFGKENNAFQVKEDLKKKIQVNA